MAILGRNYYPAVRFCGDRSSAHQFFLKALRFSTHGEFYIDKQSMSFLPSITPHFHLLTDFFDIDFQHKFEFSGRKFSVTDNSLMRSIKYNLFATIDVDTDLDFIDFIVNPDRSIVYVCSGKINGHITHKCISQDNIQLPIELIELLVPGDIITLERCLNSNRYKVYLNLFNERWHLYRSIGINIPLLILQTLLGFNVFTLPLICPKNVNFSVSDFSGLNYLELPHVIWFDLDETLVCRWKPIDEMVKFLKGCISNGHDVRLLTRHTFDVAETLEKIQVKPSWFTQIIVISRDQKKSSYVEKNQGFIDNEFAERMDVRKNSGTFVMDLDQIDYFSFPE